MKVMYESPEIQEILFATESIVVTSTGLNQGEEWNQDNVGDYDKIFG